MCFFKNLQNPPDKIKNLQKLVDQDLKVKFEVFSQNLNFGEEGK